MNETPANGSIEPVATEASPPKRSKARLILSIAAQVLLILAFVVVVFVMWLPAIVSRK